MEDCTWQVISQTEYEMAEKIATELIEKKKCINEYANIIMHIEQYIHGERVELQKPFSSGDDCISNNIVSQIAYFLSEKLVLNREKGVVLTSNILAEDMAKMSIIEWLYSNTALSRKTVVDYLYGKESISPTDERVIKDNLVALTWYDPCIGGGVFPMAIIDVYRKLGIATVPNIYGNDLNLLYVAATKKRIELSLGESKSLNLDEHFFCQDALDCNLAQYNLFSRNETERQYDIVIGNPPYVKAGKIERKAKQKYDRNYPELENKGADLYTYFISHGLNALKDNGILTFVTPAQFQMSNYGKSIRHVIEKKGDICTVADFNELPVFKKIGVHTTVFSISKAKRGQGFVRYEYDTLPEKAPFERLYSQGTVFPQKNVSGKGWFFSSTNAYKILEYLESTGIPLREYSGSVLSGIKSSCKAAFFVKERDISGFKDSDLCKCRKMLLPKNIKRWSSTWKDDFMIVVKKNELLDESSKLYEHMKKYKDKLSARSDVAGHCTWYGLRACGYYEKFDKPKIIYPDIATECRFSMDKESLYIPDGAFFIPGENYYLLGLLNSCVGRYYFRHKCARIGNPMKGGRIRFKKVYIDNFPIVYENENMDVANKIRNLALHAVEAGFLTKNQEIQLDKYVMQMYRIPDDMRLNILEE